MVSNRVDRVYRSMGLIGFFEFVGLIGRSGFEGLGLVGCQPYHLKTKTRIVWASPSPDTRPEPNPRLGCRA